MATSEMVIKDMYDVGLKPRMIRTLLKEDVPDDKIPFDSPSKLSCIISCIQSHKLLSEPSITDNNKQIERWKSSVNDWVARLLSLISKTTTTPDKCWAGICLLGVTCQECNADRFLGSYAAWFDKMLTHIQSRGDSQFVKVAACTSISDLITRLAGFPNVKKEGTSLAGKVIQPVLKLLNEDSSEAVLEGAIHLLCTVISSFPATLQRHHESVEAAITSKIFSGKFSVNLMKKLAHCLALLPESKGDEDSWISAMRKVLLLVNGYLTEIFTGLEEETKWDEAVRLLVPPGEVPPPSLWGQKLLEDTSDKERKRSKLCSISMFILSCCEMLTNSYPVQVSVPVRSLLALVERVLMVNGSLSPTTSSFVILAEQEFICSELPVLHSYALELLASVIKGIRSQLLPHAAYIVRLVKEYFKRCELPELRIKVYSITKLLLMSMGIGIAIYLAQEVVNCSLHDLNPIVDGTSFHANAKSELLLPPFHRKRKHGATGSLEQLHDRIGLEVEASKNRPTAISVKIAALGALETLLTVGGGLRSESWRSKVDNLLITIATESCKEGWVSDESKTFLPNESTLTCSDLQLAALHALLASLLSPSRVRPPHLAPALEIFRRGRQEIGTKVSEFCAYALLALEVLIHPRALPLADFPSASSFNEVNHRFPENIYSVAQKHSNPFSSGVQDTGHGLSDSDDDLYKSWLDSSKETESPVGESMDTERVQQGENIPVAGSSGAKSPWRNGHSPAAASADIEIRRGDETMVDSQQLQESMEQHQESSKGASIPTVTGDPNVTTVVLTSFASKDDALNSRDTEMASLQAVVAGESDGLATKDGNTTTLSAQKGTTFAIEDDNQSTDSVPDIVDVDPDSD
ncbi:proline-, glutamic acid- and leucine-rich protein 1 [Populus alba x Populus x berolinensis]|uniref:Proline-, glutamic acid- and leucine-rich protein 1 n=1 Tax=Populus alba x Populus x berolinensis TaxID=444605 RepID=A0AAD6MDN6_9ROSI|nr:proline-, glutamic acid- and leucine-rich protein 1 [Populus alba x Populus x berolinensis]